MRYLVFLIRYEIISFHVPSVFFIIAFRFRKYIRFHFTLHYTPSLFSLWSFSFLTSAEVTKVMLEATTNPIFESTPGAYLKERKNFRRTVPIRYRTLSQLISRGRKHWTFAYIDDGGWYHWLCESKHRFHGYCVFSLFI